MKRIIRGGLLAVAAAAAMAQTAPANAVVIAQETFQLTSDHCSNGGCLGTAASAGTITVNINGNGSATVDVALNAGFNFVSTGFDVDFGFNLAGNPQITYSNVTSTFTPLANPEDASVFTSGPQIGTPSLHMDGTGFFEYGLICSSCGSGGSNPQPPPLDFTISTASALTLASFEQNPNGQFFAVDLLGNGNTGGVDASTGTIVCQPGPIPCGGGTNQVPEPSSLAAIGGALALFGIWWRRRMSA